jgi:hypothetical protein
VSAAPRRAAPLPAVTATDGAALGEHVEEIDRDAIVKIKALEQTRYNKTAAAKLLGMSFRAHRSAECIASPTVFHPSDREILLPHKFVLRCQNIPHNLAQICN